MSRLLSPAGFVVVGLLFLPPFFRVTFLSGEDPVTIAFHGTDLLTRRRPHRGEAGGGGHGHPPS